MIEDVPVSWQQSVRRSRSAWLLALILLLAVGCGGSSGSSSTNTTTPAPASTPTASSTICADLNALQHTGDQIRNTPKERQSLPALQAAAATAKQQVDKLIADAHGQYEAQTAATSAAVSALQDSVKAAKQNPNAATLSAVRVSAAGLVTALQNLRKAIPAGC